MASVRQTKSRSHEDTIEEKLHELNEKLDYIAVEIGVLTGVLVIIAIIIGKAFLQCYRDGLMPSLLFFA